ncbi:hypothetical protein [Dermabacter hominis]|uniref:hypothetical protein n=1 Tax=Dermabacter hominis TaxID=36740 RepID=UPI0021A6D1F9|nr:hypothetical protein [Dermabacter hominis]MCT1716718.1 hypothetical protein [Dermabacter hominis]
MTDPYTPPPGTFSNPSTNQQQYQQPQYSPQGQQPNVGYAPGGAYDGPAPGTDVGNDISKSFSWAWQAFTKNWVALVVPGVIWGAIYLIILAVFFVGYFASITAMANSFDASESNGTEALAIIIFILVMYAIMILIQLPLAAWMSGAARSAGLVARGQTPTIGNGLFHWKTFLTYILYGILSTVAIIIPLIGPLACMFFFSLAPYLSAGRDAGPISAFKDAANKALAKPAHVILAAIVSFAVMFALAITGIGLLLLPVALPFTALFYMSMLARIEGTRPAPVV